MIIFKPSNKNKIKKFAENLISYELLLIVVFVLSILLIIRNVETVNEVLETEPEVFFELDSGLYKDPVEIVLNAFPPNSDIRYTLDGSDPDENSQIYDSPINIENTKVIKSALFNESERISDIKNRTYIVNDTFSLPVLSITMDPKDLWDDQVGIYVEGNPPLDPDEKFVRNFQKRGNEWRKEANIEYFDLIDNGQLTFRKEGKINIHGNMTRSYPQKSLRFCVSGKNDFIEYKIFKDTDLDKFKCILIRNSGNDWFHTLFRDALVQGLLTETTLDIQYYQPVVVFLNGEYWGIQNIRSYYDEFYFKNKYGLDSKNITVLHPNREKEGYPDVDIGKDGDEKHYVDLVNFINSNDMSLKPNYEYVKTQMDVNNYIDYFVINIYSNNSDWGDSNVKLWRYKNDTMDFNDPNLPYGLDGRWRWLVYDMDEAFGSPRGNRNTLQNNIELKQGTPVWVNSIFINLLKNEEFKEDFIRRYLYHYNYTYKPDRVIDLIDKFEKNIEPEMPRHISKWGGIKYKFNQSIGSLDEWKDKVQIVRDFAKDRRVYVIGHLVSVFELPGSIEVKVNLRQGEYIKIDDLVIDENGWSGEYVKGLTYKLQAYNTEGNKFSGWVSNGDILDNELSYKGDELVYIEPEFEYTENTNILENALVKIKNIFESIVDNLSLN